MHKFALGAFRAALLAASLGVYALVATPLAAQTVIVAPSSYGANETSMAVTSAAAGYTNSTTTASTVATLTVPPSYGPGQYGEMVEACVYGDVTKATSGTGALQLTFNGVLATDSPRYTGFGAGRNNIGYCYTIARPVSGAFPVVLQGVSSDTAAFTVTAAQLKVRTYFVLSGK